MRKQKKIVVIGAGFGGLSSAIRLAATGHEVTLIDKRDQPGGRGYQYEQDGFKFDGGPTVITAPYMIEELFACSGKKMQDYIDLIPLDPFYRIFNQKGEAFNYYRETEQAEKEIAKFSPDDVEGYKQFVKSTETVFEKFHPYTEKPFLKFSDMLGIIPSMLKTGTLQSMYSYAAKYVKDDFIRKVCSFHPLLVGGNPFDTPSIFGLIIQFEKNWGVHYCKGGTGALVAALAKLFTENGGTLMLSEEVSQINMKNKSVESVSLKSGQTIETDIVVSNADSAFTYLKLINKKDRPLGVSTWLNTLEYSNSLVVIYFGTNRRYLDSKFDHHNIILNERYKELLKDVFNKKIITKDFSLYLHMPTITDESIAPEGCESFYVLSLVPNLAKKNGPDWNEIRESYKQKIYQFLEDNYLPDLRKHIVTDHMIDPIHFEKDLNSHIGASFSIKPSMTQTAWFRPHNKSRFFKGLYFVGAGTHPGAGVPAVMASGKIAAELIQSDYKSSSSAKGQVKENTA